MRPNPDFYESLNEALETVQKTGTIELELDEPLYLAEVRALSFRLLRRGRVDQVKTLKMRCEFKPSDDAACIRVLQELLERMPHLEGLFLSNLNSPDSCRQVVQGCRHARSLRRLAIGCNNSGETPLSCISPDIVVGLPNPALMEKLGLGYISGIEMQGFCQAFEKMTCLRELGLGLGQGTTDEACQLLLDSIANLQSLRALYLWAPDEADFTLSPGTLHRLNLIMRKGLLQILSIEDLPGFFANRSSQAFTDFLKQVAINRSLLELTLEGNVGLEEESTLAIFQAVESNCKLAELHVKDVTLSEKGWAAVLSSLSRNNYLAGLSIRALSTPDMNVGMGLQFSIIEGLRKNTSLTLFSCFIDGGYHLCTHSSSQLGVLSRRNAKIGVIRKLCQSPQSSPLPASLLPRAVRTIMSSEGGRHATFLLLQNFASCLAEGNATVPKMARARAPSAHSNKKKRANNRRVACSAMPPPSTRTLRSEKRRRTTGPNGSKP